MEYPRFDVKETVGRLRESLETIEWAVGITSAEWTHELPKFYPADSWTVAMNVAHLALYDEAIANPVVLVLADGGDGAAMAWSTLEESFASKAKALAEEPMAAVSARLRAAREEQIALVESFSDEGFNSRVTPLWNSGIHGTPPHSPGWVANKTFQHTFEHGNAVLRTALFAPRP